MVRRNNPRLSDEQVQALAAELREAFGPLQAADGDGGSKCLTCGGTGRLRHPRTGKPSRQCPECNGTGVLAPEASDRGGGQYAKHVRFERGQVTVVNRAAASGAAWERLVRTALQVGRQGG